MCVALEKCHCHPDEFYGQPRQPYMLYDIIAYLTKRAKESK